MAKQKQPVKQIKVQVKGGQATPAPPVGTALGPHGVNIGQFVSQFNEQTRDRMGLTLPCVITIYSDRSFDFIIKSPPAAVMLKQSAKIAKGAHNARTEHVGTVTKADVLEIAKVKLEDMNASSVEQAVKTIEGTARSMGIKVVD